MLCFYHKVDYDGICSAAIVKHFYPTCSMIGIDYGEKLPWDLIPNQEVYMVDFALEPFQQMVELNQMAKKLVWIDHHKTHIEAYNKYYKDSDGMGLIDGLRMVGRAGCELTWYYHTTEPTPYPVTLLGRYDVWDLNDKNVLPFQYYMRSRNIGPSDSFWKLLLDIYDDNMIQKNLYAGHQMIAYDEATSKAYLKRYGFYAVFETNRGIFNIVAVNRGFIGSRFFESANDYQIMMSFVVDRGEDVRVSLYTKEDDINVGAIAKDFGGGGHQKAAGFIIPFKDLFDRIQVVSYLDTVSVE